MCLSVPDCGSLWLWSWGRRPAKPASSAKPAQSIGSEPASGAGVATARPVISVKLIVMLLKASATDGPRVLRAVEDRNASK